MTELKLSQIDAFADRPFTGNPAAVMPLDAWLPDELLQAIAMENNLSETAFTIPDASGEADYELRWFTPTVEIALCGHATLASAHVLIGQRERSGSAPAAGIRGSDGMATATSCRPAYPPTAKPCPPARAGMQPVETLWHERGYALIVLRDEAAVRALAPDFKALAAEGDVTIITTTAPGETAEVVSRVFVPAAGVDEDPVTGAAHAVLVPYWSARMGRSDAIGFFQASHRGGYLSGRLDGERAVLGGRCVTVIEGIMRI